VPRAKAKLETGWWVYVLRCADGTLYTGVTTDCDRRLLQHNAGTASKYTRSRRPVAMAYRERAKSHGAALRREIAIKKLSRPAKDALIATQRARKRA
jgi:putative endonuclease